MEFLGITALILLIYARSYKYQYLIDDNTDRYDYLRNFSQDEGLKPKPEFYDQKRPYSYTAINIVTMIVICYLIYVLWGWKVALLYAVFPLNVCCNWKIGNFYMTTAGFILASYYFLISHEFGWIPALACYWVALESTLPSAVPFALFASIVAFPQGLLMFIPLAFHLFGKKLSIHLKERAKRGEERGYNIGDFHPRMLIIMTKVIGFYIYLSMWPSRLAFFYQYLKDESEKGHLLKITPRFWCAGILIVLFGIFTYQVDPVIFWGWFLFMGIFSQFRLYGQFVADRYTLIPNVFFCLFMAQLTANHDVLYAILATLYFYRSHLRIKDFKSNEVMFASSITSQPRCADNHVNLSSIYLDRNDPFKAIPHLLRASQLAWERKSNIHANLSNAYYACGFFDKSMKHAKLALIDAEADKIEGLKGRIQELEGIILKVRRREKEFKTSGIL